LIREIKAQLMSGETQSLDEGAQEASSWRLSARCSRGDAGRRPSKVQYAVMLRAAFVILPAVCGSWFAITWFVTGIWVEWTTANAGENYDDLAVLAVPGNEQA
jgi:hypothetical protein